MPNNAHFSVYSTGEAEDGHETATVQQEFAKLFGISDEKAERYFSNKKLIRKGLTQKQATDYQVNLKKIGMATVIESAIVKAPASNDASVSAAAAAPATAGLSLLPEDHTESTSSSSTSSNHQKTITCPSCKVDQDKSPQCTACGIFFNKVSGSADATTRNAKRSAKEVSEAKSAKSAEHHAGDDANFIFPVLVASVVALILAFVWKLITIQTGYEFGIVAWAIGGIIGFVAARTGGRGEVAAVACAVLAVCAILGGKYMIEDYYLTQAESLFSGEVYDEVESEYSQMQTDIENYQAIEQDDYTVKRFMSDEGYTNADSVTEISDEELEEFRVAMTFNIEMLEVMPDLEAALGEMQEAHELEMGSESTFSYMMSNIGILGIIFILLGMSTAYKLVRYH